MKKKNFFSLLAITAVFLALLFYIYAKTSEIGFSLRHTHPYLQYGYYGLIGILVLLFLIRPFFIILFAPSFTLYQLKTIPSNHQKGIMVKNYAQLEKISWKLIRSKLIKDENIMLLKTTLSSHEKNFAKKYNELKRVVNQVVSEDIKKDIRKIIIATAKDTMYLTALSQNSFLDFLIVATNNFRMVKKIVQRCGFRPSFFRLFKLYINVVMSSFIAEGAQNIDFSSLLGNSLKGLAKPVIGSVVEGALNSYFMLRTGFLTKNYIFNEINDSTEFNIINSAMVEAAAAIPELAIHSVVKPIIDVLMGTLVTPTKSIVKKVFFNKDLNEEYENIG